MIQVCSRCGTRWNVRDRQRVWCPRCNGTLLAPSAPPPPSEWSARPTAPPVRPSGQAQIGPPRLPAGIPLDRGSARCRAAAAPPTAANLGPTPRYAVIPRWGLVERFDTAELEQQAVPRRGPSLAALRATLVATIAVLGVAALVHMVRYVLLIINRNVLLNPVVAWLATWLGVLVSVAAVFMVFATFVLLTNWLIARRAAAFKHVGRQEHRPLWALRAGCLVPFVNLAWAPVFVLELANVEDCLARLRRPIVVWWARVGAQHGGVGVLHRDQLHHRRAGHRRQHGHDDRRLPPRDGGDGSRRPGASRLRAQAGRAAGQALGDRRRPNRQTVSTRNATAKPILRVNPAFRLSPKARTRQHSRMNSGDASARRPPVRGGAPRRVGRPPRAHAGRLRARPARGRRRRGMRCPADPGRPSGVRARPPGGPHVQRHRAGQRDVAGSAEGVGFRLVARQLAARRVAGRHRAADARRPGVAGAGLAPAGEDLHRDQASGALRRAGGKQSAGAAASVRHRVARRRRTCRVRW